MAALFLLGLFCFIYAEKVMHVHGIRSSSSLFHHDEPVIKKSTCAICDFQLNKEFVTPVLTFPDPLLIIVDKDSKDSHSFIFANTHLSVTSRGPPAQLFHYS